MEFGLHYLMKIESGKIIFTNTHKNKHIELLLPEWYAVADYLMTLKTPPKCDVKTAVIPTLFVTESNYMGAQYIGFFRPNKGSYGKDFPNYLEGLNFVANQLLDVLPNLMHEVEVTFNKQ